MAQGLSKTRYTQFCKCEKALWLNVFDPDKATPLDDSQKARFEQGTEVGVVAREFFPGGIDVTTQNGCYQDRAAMVAKTKAAMRSGISPIYEAAFSLDGNYCAVDILRKTKNGWAIYEVKSTSYPDFDGKPSELKRYAPDIAYQKWLLEQCGVNVTDVHLICLNSNYIRHGALDIKKLFVVVDFDKFIADEYAKVPANVDRAQMVLDCKTPPDWIDIGEQCPKPYECSFWKYCKKQKGLPEPSVFDVYGGSMKSRKEDRFFIGQKLEHYRAGRWSFEDLKGQPLGHVQKLHVEGKPYVDKNGLREFLDTLSYPLYFLDFETMQYAIPQFEGTKPYQQVTFQYSLHIKRSPDDPYEHREFLADSDGSCPLPAAAQQLCTDIPEDVCVLVYNKTFECSRLKEMADIFPDLSAHLLNIRDNIKDLLDPFQAGYYYLPAMNGSFSIKSVLPALFPDDPQMDYHNLPGSVHNGGEAMTIFPSIKDMPTQEEKDAARKSLLEYCHLDTLAMVRVWERLKENIL